MNRSTIFLTTPTSATASMWRIFAIIRGTEQPWWWTQTFWKDGRQEELRTTVPPTDGQYLMMNFPSYLNRNIEAKNYRWILNIRDPRDMLCNQYHWAQQHPEPGRSEAELEAHRQAVIERGIDQFVLDRQPEDVLPAYRFVVENAAPEDICVLTYALLCTQFDRFTAKAKAFLGHEDLSEDQARRLEGERVESLESNTDWIGSKWSGSDTLPGRYKRELRPETIAVLNERYGDLIRFIRSIDEPSVAHYYDL